MTPFLILVLPLSLAVFTVFVFGLFEACATAVPAAVDAWRARRRRHRRLRPIVFTLGLP